MRELGRERERENENERERERMKARESEGEIFLNRVVFTIGIIPFNQSH